MELNTLNRVVWVDVVSAKKFIGGLELIGAGGLIPATVLAGEFSSDPLPWRILAIFMGAEGLKRLR